MKKVLISTIIIIIDLLLFSSVYAVEPRNTM